MDAIRALRHDLHRIPELSSRERDTAARVRRFFDDLGPDQVIEGLGGHGLLFAFDGLEPGPSVMLRCELDALPIDERPGREYASTRPGTGHQCGHDGHMAILAGVGAALAVRRPRRGRALLLYQPAEESGEGAPAVLADPRFQDLTIDQVFALHNIPGAPLGQVLVREGPVASASRGLCLSLTGATAHAASPESGRSPAPALSRLIEALPAMTDSESGTRVTVVGARLGDKSFGIAPGHAEIWATLRTETNPDMARLVEQVESLASAVAAASKLDWAARYEEVFPATVNHPDAVEVVRQAAGAQLTLKDRPFPWSEDFGHFCARYPGALFGLGAGEDQPDLHTQDYDFPDPLLAHGTTVFNRILAHCLG